MRAGTTLVSAMLIILGVACDGRSSAELSAEHAAAITDSVRALLADYEEQVRAGAWDRVLDFYAEDPRFHWLEDGTLAYSSRDEIGSSLEWLASRFSDVQTSFEDPRVVPLAPGVAHVASPFRQSFVTGGGDTVSISGVVTAIAVRTDDGWKLLAGHSSTPNPERQR